MRLLQPFEDLRAHAVAGDAGAELDRVGAPLDSRRVHVGFDRRRAIDPHDLIARGERRELLGRQSRFQVDRPRVAPGHDAPEVLDRPHHGGPIALAGQHHVAVHGRRLRHEAADLQRLQRRLELVPRRHPTDPAHVRLQSHLLDRTGRAAYDQRTARPEADDAQTESVERREVLGQHRSMELHGEQPSARAFAQGGRHGGLLSDRVHRAASQVQHAVDVG